MSAKAVAGVSIAVIAGVGGLMALSLGGLHWQGFLGKKAEEIRYDIHKESQTYRDGMQRNLMQMQTDYMSADSDGKAAIIAAIRHQYSQTDVSEYPQHLKEFLATAGVY